MTLTAINKNTGERVCLLGMSGDPREQLPQWKDFVCPITASPVFPKRSHSRRSGSKWVGVVAHWVSKHEQEWPLDVLEDPEYIAHEFRVGESVEHLNGKIYIAENAHKIDPLCTSDLARFEERIYIPHHGKYRIADVSFHLPCGLIRVFEVQLSPISAEDLKARTVDYHRAGVDVTWVFGEKNSGYELSELHKRLCSDAPLYITIKSISDSVAA